MNAETAKIAALAPDWVKRERRRELRFWGSLVVAIIAIAGATYAVVVNKEQDTQITRIEPKVTKLEQTPCAKDATSRACQKLRAEVEMAAGIQVTCIPFRRAGYLCPRPGSELAERQASVGGDAQQTGSTGHQQPSPSPSGGGGSGTEAGKGGGHGSPSPSSGGGAPGARDTPSAAPSPSGATDSPSPPNASSVPNQSPPTNEAATPEPHPLPETVEAAGGAVEKTGESAQGAVEAVGGTAKCVLKGAC